MVATGAGDWAARAWRVGGTGSACRGARMPAGAPRGAGPPLSAAPPSREVGAGADRDAIGAAAGRPHCQGATLWAGSARLACCAAAVRWRGPAATAAAPSGGRAPPQRQGAPVTPTGAWALQYCDESADGAGGGGPPTEAAPPPSGAGAADPAGRVVGAEPTPLVAL